MTSVVSHYPVHASRPHASIRFAATLIVCLMCFGGCGSDDPPADDASRLARAEYLYLEYRQSFPTVPEVTAAQAMRMLADGQAVLVDIRERRETEVSMIAGAITAEHYERAPHVYSDRTAIIYCTIGSRSGHYAQRLHKRGVATANLRGGVLLWAHEGGPFLAGAEPTRLVHVYGQRWDLLPQSFQSIY